MSAERELFIQQHADEVIEATQGTGLFPSVKMAQMIIESANSKGQPGQGITALKAKNYFGIKADKGWTGEKMAFNTPNDGQPVSYFRVYPAVIDSIRDHSSFLIKNSRYRTNGVFDAKTPEDQAYALAKAGYSEKPYPQYATALISLINAYDLKRLDTMMSKKKS
jgi:flagellum-specific peptidoglycan hydrolase FlgJ